MDRLIPIGRAFFAIGLIGLGLDHFLFGEFVTGRAPAWPASMPGGPAWAYLSGLVFVVTAVQILGQERAFRRDLCGSPRVSLGPAPLHTRAWGESVSFSGVDERGQGPAVHRRSSRHRGHLAETGNRQQYSSVEVDEHGPEFILAGRMCVGVTLVLNGIQHFMFVGLVASLIPGWFPGDARFWTYFGGIALIAGGVGLLIPRTARLAALLSGLMVLSWFFIVHVSREIAGVADGIAVFEALLTSGILFVLTARGAPLRGKRRPRR